jgi:hypothetical protein
MRKMMFFCWIAWAKFGCWILQPVASVPACDHEEIVHAAIGCGVRIFDEPRLANGAVRGNKGRHGVGGAGLGGNRDLRISRRAAAAD